MVAVGAALTTTAAVVLNAAHPPEAAMLYVTVYVPALLEPKVIAPVLELIERPEGVALYVPPVLPVRVTFAVPPEVQKGEPL
jgi:hypothetical protein